MSTLKAGLLGSTAKAPEGGLTEKLEMLGRHKMLLTLGAVVGLCAGVAAGFVIAPRYQARVAMQIQNPNADFLNARNVSSVAEASAADSGNLTDVATEIKIMESDQLLDRVIATLRAAGEASALEAGAEQLSLVSRLLHRAPPEGDRLGYRLRELVRPNLSIKQVGPTRAVEIVYSAGDPLFAAKFANSFAEQYIEMSEEVRRSRNRHTEESLSQQLEEVRGRLKQSPLL